MGEVQRIRGEDVHHAYYRHVAAQAVARADLTMRLGAVTDVVARAVLDLHRRDGRDCVGCDLGGADMPEWPCWTVLLVADTCRVTVPDVFLDDLAAAKDATR